MKKSLSVFALLVTAAYAAYFIYLDENPSAQSMNGVVKDKNSKETFQRQSHGKMPWSSEIKMNFTQLL